jgi:hypothetical protein
MLFPTGGRRPAYLKESQGGDAPVLLRIEYVGRGGAPDHHRHPFAIVDLLNNCLLFEPIGAINVVTAKRAEARTFQNDVHDRQRQHHHGAPA